MREGRQLVRDSKPFATDQRGRSWWYFLSTLVLLIGALGVTCTHLSWIVRLPASILAALLHVRLFVIYHDFQHCTILEGSRVAGFLFRIYGIFLLTPAGVWRHTHDHHHRNNSRRFGVDSTGSFPVMSIEDYRKASSRDRFVYALSRHPLILAFGYLTVFFYGFCVQPLLTNPRRHLDSAWAAVIHLGLIVSLAVFRPDVMLLAVILPMFVSSAIGAYLFYAQHNFPGVKLRPGGDWDYVYAALRSSSFIRMSPVMHWFTGNIGYHHIHHLNSRIPFYRLPETMAAMEELQTPTTTSLGPVDVFRCLRLKLWDPDKDHLVSFAESRETGVATAV